MDGPWTNTPPTAPGIYLGLKPIAGTNTISLGAGEAGHFVILIIDQFGNQTFTELQPSLQPDLSLRNRVAEFVSQEGLQDRNLQSYEWTQVGGTDMIPSLDQAIMTETNLYAGQIYYVDARNSNTFATDVLIAAGIKFPKGRFWAPLVPVAACWDSQPCGPWF
jgi:hypothetical protein